MSELINVISILKLVAVIHALFFGLRAVYIFSPQRLKVSEGSVDQLRKLQAWEDVKYDISQDLKDRPDYYFYQFVFNFLGVIVGYFSLYILWNIQPGNYGWEELLILLVGFVGVTGNLPWFIMLKGFPGK